MELITHSTDSFHNIQMLRLTYLKTYFDVNIFEGLLGKTD
jgi:hypothetical protein